MRCKTKLVIGVTIKLPVIVSLVFITYSLHKHLPHILGFPFFPFLNVLCTNYHGQLGQVHPNTIQSFFNISLVH